MTGTVVALSRQRTRRVRDRLGIDRRSHQRLGELDQELRTVEQAIKALNRRRQSVMMRFRAQMRREAESEAREQR
jgi:hypothetical protein